MSGFRNGFVKLDSPRDVFYPGQVVLGSVVFEIEQPFTLAVLYADFVGEAKVDWKESQKEVYNGVERYRPIEYVGREEYFNVRQVLAGGHNPVSLPPGTHTYQFSYQLPPGCPSSFSGERGDVTYCVKATLDLRGQTSFQQQLDKNFEVVAPFNLNFGHPKLKDPIEFEFEEVAGCCFGSNPVNVRIRLPVSGYCPGQVVPVELDIDNSSNVEIRKMIFQILTRERYRTQRPVAEFVPPERVLSTISRGAVLSGTTKTVTVDVPLPELIAPNLENCSIIDVGYFFKATIKLSGCNDDLEDEAEICLGLIPLDETVNGEYVHPLSQSLPIGPIPDIPVTNIRENIQENHQQNAYPGQPHSGYPTSGYPTSDFQTDPNVKTSYTMEVREFSYSSSDPSKNYNIGFTINSPDPIPDNYANYPRQTNLKIHLPQANFDINTPSAPPPST